MPQVRSDSIVSATGTISHRATRSKTPATSRLSQVTGNPYLDAERERDEERALMDRALKDTKTFRKKQATVNEEADEGEEPTAQRMDKGKRRAVTSDDQVGSRRMSKGTSKVSNGTKSTKSKKKGERQATKKKAKEKEDVEKELPGLEATGEETDFVIDGILKAEYIECHDELQQRHIGWAYTIKWHDYTIEETASEDPITWRMFGPRPNKSPISFWQELRKQSLVPPLRNSAKAKAMKKEMLRELRAEEEREKGKENGVKERTDEEWEEWWMQLRDEWEPEGQIGQVFHAPIRLENKWYRESLENYEDEREKLVRVIEQHKPNAKWDKYEHDKLALAQTNKHIADVRRRIKETTEKIRRMGLKLLSIESDNDEDVARPANATIPALEASGSVPPATTADQAIKRGAKRPRRDSGPEDAGISNPRPKKKVARLDGENNVAVEARPPKQAESLPKAISSADGVHAADADRPVRNLPPPPSTRHIPSRPHRSPATEYRRKNNLFAGDDSDDEQSPFIADAPLTSAAPKGSIHRPRWELHPHAAAPSVPSQAEQRLEGPLASAVNPADSRLVAQAGWEPSQQDFDDAELAQPLEHPSINVGATLAQVIDLDAIGDELLDVDAVSIPPSQTNQPPVNPFAPLVVRPPPAQPSSSGKAMHPLIRSETGFRLCIRGPQATSQFIARVAVWPELTTWVQTFASALSALGPSPQNVTFTLCLPANAATDLLTGCPFHQTGTVVLSSRLNDEERTQQDRMLQAMTEGLTGHDSHDMTLFAQLTNGLAIVIWQSASQNSGRLGGIPNSPPRLLCALVTLDFEQALQELPRPQSALAKPVDPTATLESVRLNELGFTSTFCASLRGLKVVIWADLLQDILHAPARASGWILQHYDDGNVSQVVIIENRYVPELLDSQDLRATVDKGLQVFALGPDPSGRAPSERLRPILRVRSGGGIVTFPPLFILKEPRLFSKVVRALRNNPFWTVYLLPQAVATVVSSLNKKLCHEPASVVAAMMDMLDVVKIRPMCPGTLTSRVKQLPLEDDLDLASDWESWVKACQSFPMVSLPAAYLAKLRHGLDEQTVALEMAQLKDLGKRREWPVGDDYEFKRVYYAGADCSLVYGLKGFHSFSRVTEMENVNWKTAEEFLAILSTVRYNEVLTTLPRRPSVL